MRKLLLVALTCLFLSGCGSTQAATSAPEEERSVESTKMSGSDFLRYPVKLKGTVSGRLSNGVSDSLKFELYIDGEGNGEGLAGHNSSLYQVNVIENVLFFWVDSETAVKVTDLSGRLNDLSLSLTGVEDLTLLGFGYTDNAVTGYDGAVNGYTISAKYVPTDHLVKRANVHDIADTTVGGVLEYIVNGEGIPELEKPVDLKPVEGNLPTKRVNSSVGVTIDGVKYSLGDTCNPSDYFQGKTPSGLIPKQVASGADTEEILYISWKSVDGALEIVTLNQKVVSIYTTCSFSWLGYGPSTEYNKVRLRLGANLSYTEKQDWVPYNSEIVCDSSNSSAIACSYRGAKYEITFDRDRYYESYRATDNLPYLSED